MGAALHGAGHVCGTATRSTFVEHYVQALAMRRKAHQMGAILGGKLPCSPVFVPGGATQSVTSAKVTEFRTLLTEIREGFINNVMVPDGEPPGEQVPGVPQYRQGLRQPPGIRRIRPRRAGSNKLLKRGRYTNGVFGTVSGTNIREYVKFS